MAKHVQLDVDGKLPALDGSKLTGLIAGSKYTESVGMPTGSATGDEWLNLSNGILYKRVSDGTQSVWIDSSGNGYIALPDKTIKSDTSLAMGSDLVTNIISLTAAEYAALTPNSSTLYIIVG